MVQYVIFEGRTVQAVMRYSILWLSSEKCRPTSQDHAKRLTFLKQQCATSSCRLRFGRLTGTAACRHFLVARMGLQSVFITYFHVLGGSSVMHVLNEASFLGIFRQWVYFSE